MFHKGKLAVFVCSTLVVLYGVSAAFYGKVVAKDEAYKELAVFIDALKKINDDYVQLPDLGKVQEGALRGLIESLDPYSSFLSREQVEAVEKRKASGKAGVGVVLSKRNELIYVVSLQRGSGADEAGVRPGDFIIAVDGTGIENASLPEAESLLRGTDGSKVKLTLFRNSRTKPVEVEATRKPDNAAPAVTSRLLDGGVGLLEVGSLAEPGIEQVRVKARTLISAGAQKLLVDLRGCADGTPAEGAELANMFVSSGLLYYTQNRSGQRVEEIRAKPDRFVSDLPLAVMINGSSAGAAEVAAGALKDAHRATLVGEKSFGIGSSQRSFALRSGGLLILSTAKVFTPSGKMIQDENPRHAGIKPDVQAPDDDRHQDLLVESYYDEADDTAKYRSLRDKIAKEQLDRALELLGKAALKKAA
jgi:carboxyl-terminal processing protease